MIITDKMVDAALDAFNRVPLNERGLPWGDEYRSDMRAALAVSGYGEVVVALKTAEAALADIGDADREPGDDVVWCERRAAKDLPTIRSALARVTPEPQS